MKIYVMAYGLKLCFLARALEDALGLIDTSENHLFIKKCPDCGQILRFESGCDVCKNCGFSSCG
jgi:hypothetical protein